MYAIDPTDFTKCSKQLYFKLLINLFPSAKPFQLVLACNAQIPVSCLLAVRQSLADDLSRSEMLRLRCHGQDHTFTARSLQHAAVRSRFGSEVSHFYDLVARTTA